MNNKRSFIHALKNGKPVCAAVQGSTSTNSKLATCPKCRALCGVKAPAQYYVAGESGPVLVVQ